LLNCPAFPERFGCSPTRTFADLFFEHYNHAQRHSGLGLHTPASVHFGTAAGVRTQRAKVLDAAYAAHPKRFVNKAPAPPLLPGSVWINKPQEPEEPEDDAQKKS